MRRFNLPAVFFVLSLLAVGGAAVASDLKTMAQKLILGDDATAKFGASTDLTIGWETADSSHERGDIVTATGVLVREDADVDLTWAAPTAGSYIGACSDDAAAPTECVYTYHDSTDGVLKIPSGNYRIETQTEGTEDPSGDYDTSVTVGFNGPRHVDLVTLNDGSGRSGMLFKQQGGSPVGGIFASTAADVLIISVDDSLADNHVAIVEDAQKDRNPLRSFSNPTLSVYSNNDPAGGTEYIDIYHDQTDGVIGTGTGDLKLSPAGDLNVAAAGDLKLAAGVHLKRYESCTCNYNSGTVACVTGLAADDLVTDCYMKVSTVWDGDGYAKCRTDTGESDVEVASFSNSKLQALGWTKSGMGNKLEGAGETYPLTGSDNSVDCVATPGTSGQGAGVMYVVIESFQ